MEVLDTNKLPKQVSKRDKNRGFFAPNAEVRCNVEAQNVKEAARGAHGAMLAGTQRTFNLGKPACDDYILDLLKLCIWKYVKNNVVQILVGTSPKQLEQAIFLCSPFLDPGKVARMLLDGNTHLGWA